MNETQIVEQIYGTNLDRVKYLGYRMANMCEREGVLLGEAKLVCELLIEEQTEKFKNLKVSDLPKSALNDFIKQVSEDAWVQFITSIPDGAFHEFIKESQRERAKIAEIRLAAQSFTQSLIDSAGEDMPLPNLEVSERDGKTVFNFLIEKTHE